MQPFSRSNKLIRNHDEDESKFAKMRTVKMQNTAKSLKIENAVAHESDGDTMTRFVRDMSQLRNRKNASTGYILE